MRLLVTLPAVSLPDTCSLRSLPSLFLSSLIPTLASGATQMLMTLNDPNDPSDAP